MTRDERRTAHLIFAGELASGELAAEDIAGPAVERAAEVKPVPSALSRRLQVRALRDGRLTWARTALRPALEARTALLGASAGGPPRVLLRLDGFDLPGFDELHAAFRDAGADHLVAVPPSDSERDALVGLRHDGAALAQLGPLAQVGVLAHAPRGLGRTLDAGTELLASLGIHVTTVAVRGDRFGERAWTQLAKRFDLVCAGTATVAGMGFHPTVHWRGDAVYVPAYPPLYRRAQRIAETIEELAELEAAVWVPAIVDVEREQADGLRGVRRLAALLGSGLGEGWAELQAAVALSRRSA